MIDELRGSEYEIIEAMGYTIYDEVGRKQNGDSTWSKILKEDNKFIVTGTRYDDGFKKKEYREIYTNIESFKTGKISTE